MIFYYIVKNNWLYFQLYFTFSIIFYDARARIRPATQISFLYYYFTTIFLLLLRLYFYFTTLLHFFQWVYLSLSETIPATQISFRMNRGFPWQFRWHDPFMWYGSCIGDTTRSYVTWLIHRDIIPMQISFRTNVSFPWQFRYDYSRVTWFVHWRYDSFTCVMTHSYVPWLIHVCHESCICDMTHSYVTWLIHVWHDSFSTRMLFRMNGSVFWHASTAGMIESCYI